MKKFDIGFIPEDAKVGSKVTDLSYFQRINYHNIDVYDARKSLIIDREICSVHDVSNIRISQKNNIDIDLYYEETTKYLESYLNASLVIPLHHKIRVSDHNKLDTSKHRKPISFMHSDYTYNGAYQYINYSHPDMDHEYLQNSEKSLYFKDNKETLLKGHKWKIYNIWRPLSDVVLNHDLVFCNPKSVEYASDLVCFYDESRLTDCKGQMPIELYCLKYNKHQEFFYFPRVTSNEAIIFQGAGSCSTSSNPFTLFHSSGMSQQNVQHDRNSIEMRVLVVF